MTITDTDRLAFIKNNFLIVRPAYIDPAGYKASTMPDGLNTWLIYRESDNKLLSKKEPYVTLESAIDAAIMKEREKND